MPIMVDSSRWSVHRGRPEVRAGQGRRNSISLKEGEEEFLAQARRIRRYGAGVVVMAFDEQGQADTVERKVAICGRAYELLTEQAGFAPEDIVFDPNVLAVATGIEEHNELREGVHRRDAADQGALPGRARSAAASRTCRSRSAATTSCARRCTRRSCYHAIRAGLDMGIVNAGQLVGLRGHPAGAARARRGRALRPPARRDRPARRLAGRVSGEGTQRERDLSWREAPVDEAARARARARHRRLHRGGHRGGAAGGAPARST